MDWGRKNSNKYGYFFHFSIILIVFVTSQKIHILPFRINGFILFILWLHELSMLSLLIQRLLFTHIIYIRTGNYKVNLLCWLLYIGYGQNYAQKKNICFITFTVWFSDLTNDHRMTCLSYCASRTKENSCLLIWQKSQFLSASYSVCVSVLYVLRCLSVLTGFLFCLCLCPSWRLS